MSMQSGNNKKVEYIPINKIMRPIQPQLDLEKVDAMVSTLKGQPMASRTCTLEQAQSMNSELPAVDIFRLKKKNKQQQPASSSESNADEYVYFSFASCHRMASYDRLQKESPDKEILVKCKIYPAIESQLRLYMGASLDHYLD